MAVEFRLLGMLEVRYRGEVVPTPAGKARDLLAALLLRANAVRGVDELVELLWAPGHANPERSRATLHMVVARLRRSLGAANVVRTAPGGYVAEVQADSVDLLRFRALTAAGRYHEALALWRGAPLPDVRADALRLAEIAPLVEEHLTVLERRIDADLDRGAAGGLVAELRSLTRQHPLRERFWWQLVLALYRSDRQADALAAYREARRVLLAELGVEPSEPLRRLHDRILAAEPAPVAPVEDRRPVVVPHALPGRNPHFVGRDAELAALSTLLDDDAHGPSTAVVTGAPGVGKTALAGHWANLVAERFPGGRVHVDLRGFDPTGRPAATGEAFRAVLGAFGLDGEHVPADPGALAARYRDVLRGRRALLVLDNARDEDQVRPLLPRGPGCRVVVTSRDRLTGLTPPGGAVRVSLDLLGPAEARALLVRRLRADRRADPAIGELADHCAGLPLALSIVAARAGTHPHTPLRAIADELSAPSTRLDYLDAGEPDVSVRDAFSWSYRLLGPRAAKVFRVIGSRGGEELSPSAAAALAGMSEQEASTALHELRRAHLLAEPRPGRFSLDDLMRCYAVERALAEGDPVDRGAG
ncbi:BTAD domain-containing putative transcriptional regulator [Saccharothrix sp. NPDC042600]|uniref:AfsR/SARP family transcriptional regulator n=1 Tax=Saccharothrix TaxID=2071 RepID=UPI0033DE9D66|nr:hypothetical protein GCM10017745_12790 [Saccharothrix mutabilis subsp. capreolus]